MGNEKQLTGGAGSGVQCDHGSQGYLFRLDERQHANTRHLEWCPGCGAHRTRPVGEWILPFEDVAARSARIAQEVTRFQVESELANERAELLVSADKVGHLCVQLGAEMRHLYDAAHEVAPAQSRREMPAATFDKLEFIALFAQGVAEHVKKGG